MNMPGRIPRVWQRVGFFILLTYVISAPFEYLAIVGGGMGAAGGLYALGGMWSPGIAAFITATVFRKEVGPFGWRWGKTRYQLWSMLIPFLYSLAGYGLVWVLGFGGLLSGEASRRLPILGQSFAITCIATLGEEIGWSGFLVPQVAKARGYTAASLTRGIAWSVWHYPMIIAGIYGNKSPLWFNLVCFTIILTGTSFIYAWFRLKSGSLWTGTFLHASHNASIQSYFTRITGATALTAFFIDEFGAALAVVATGLAILFWKMRGMLPGEALPPPLPQEQRTG
jgi:membrane protease YdiL (CAAX protease family)